MGRQISAVKPRVKKRINADLVVSGVTPAGRWVAGKKAYSLFLSMSIFPRSVIGLVLLLFINMTKNLQPG